MPRYNTHRSSGAFWEDDGYLLARRTTKAHEARRATSQRRKRTASRNAGMPRNHGRRWVSFSLEVIGTSGMAFVFEALQRVEVALNVASLKLSHRHKDDQPCRSKQNRRQNNPQRIRIVA